MGSDFDETNFGQLMSNTSFNDTSIESVIDEEESPLPYEIPDCPADSQLRILYKYPDSVIESYFYSRTDKIMISIVMPFIITLGILSNGAFLLTVVRVREMRTLTNFYLVNLACADLLFVDIAGVNYFYKYIWSSDIDRFVPWTSTTGCAMINGATYITLFASICLITLVSIERFLAICYPFQHRMMNDKPRTIKMVAVTWLIAIASSAAVSLSYARLKVYYVVWPEKYQDRLPSIVSVCLYIETENVESNDFLDILSILQFLPFIVALCINSTLYGFIIYRLSKREINEGNEQTQLQVQAQKTRNSVACMLVINGIAFFVLLVPFQFYNLYYYALRNDGVQFLSIQQSIAMGRVARGFNALNSAINPFIYSTCNARYRRAFVSTFKCFSFKQHGGNSKVTGSNGANTTTTNQSDTHM